MKLLLISNSTNYGETYFAWPRPYVKSFLGADSKDILFIPYAGVTISYDDYTMRIRDIFKELGHHIHSVHQHKDPVAAVREASCIAVGGGNTFHLVYMLHKLRLMQPIREQVLTGVPYMGWSAGANVACPSMKTTNDMPIIQPASFDCLNLVSFQINPHYLDAHPEGHGGETREQRIIEFLVVNPEMNVVGLREGTLLQVDADHIELKGKRPLRLFHAGKESTDINPGEPLDFLLKL